MKQTPDVLITGGLGNLGSWLTRHFIQAGHKVTVLAKNRRQLVEDLNFEFLECDIADFRSCQQALEGRKFGKVIHTASVNDGFVDGYFELANRVNVLGTRNLLEALKDASVEHFLYFSTFQVYGQYSGVIDELTPPQPKNDYGSTHLFAEYYIRQFHLTQGLPYTIIRLTNSYGCPMDLNSSKWYLILNDLSRSAFDNQKIILKSNGKSQRDFIWMGTVASAVEQILEQPAQNDIYNLSGQQTFDMIQVADRVQQAYRNKYDHEVEISVNTDDKTEYPQDLMVRSEKLRQRIEILDEDHFEREAIKIFELLENQKNQ